MQVLEKKNIGRNPIVDCERNGERIEIKRIENEMKVQLENGNKSPFTNWRFIPIPIKKLKQNSKKITKIE